MPDCHTSTGEWQQFEHRMRRRRADRCLLRASAALDADVPKAAQAVLAEAEALCPKHPELQEVAGRLQSCVEPPHAATQEAAAQGYWFQVLGALTLLSLLVAGGW